MRAIVWLSLLVICGCGYVGEPLPPALNIPQPPVNLEVVEIGDKLVVSYNQPGLSTEGLPIKRAEAPAITINGQNQTVSLQTAAAARYEFPAAQWADRDISVEVRANNNGRLSEPVRKSVHVIQPLPTPKDFRAEADPRGVRLTWTAPARDGVQYAITRQARTDQAPTTLATTKDQLYVDTTAEYGTEYTYRAKAVSGAAMSAQTDSVTLTPIDRFPPAAPTALNAIAGVGSVELAWERDQETDLRSYKIYRALKGSELTVLSDTVTGPAYSDRQIEAGKTYVYAVTAVDQRGNESARSANVEVNTQ